jgi:hypothetical protein
MIDLFGYNIFDGQTAFECMIRAEVANYAWTLRTRAILTHLYVNGSKMLSADDDLIFATVETEALDFIVLDGHHEF